MTYVNPPVGEARRPLAEAIQAYSTLFITYGIVLIILGIISIIWPAVATVAVNVFIGWLLLIGGVVGFVTMFSSPSVPAFLWALLTAALSAFAGLLLLWHPVGGIITLTLVLVAFFIVEGIFHIGAGIRYRRELPDSWGWLIMSGVVDLVLAAIIIAGWPGTARWALGLIVGVNLITSGLAITMIASAGRNVFNALSGAFR